MCEIHKCVLYYIIYVIYTYMVQPVPEKMRLEMIVEIQIEILDGISYGAATISRLLRIIGLFCKRAL